MNNQRNRSDFNSDNMGRRYRGKYGHNLRTKWDRKLPNDISVQMDRTGRQIRFNEDDNNNHNEHDDRFQVTNRRSHNERGDRSFQNWASKGPRNRRGGPAQQQSRYRYSRRPPPSYDDLDSEMRNKEDADSQWFKITIPHGVKHDKQTLLQLIHSETQLTFTPYNYHTEGNAAVFYVLGMDTADTLRAISRKVSFPTGHKVVILINRSAIPPTILNEDLTEKIKIVMSQRFDVNTNVMDLSKFREDQNFQQLGLYVSLSRPNVLNTVIKIIVENTPQIVALNFKDNKIQSLETLVQLAVECRQLKALDLSKNQIKNVIELDHIKALDLLELALEGNPVCDTFEDQANYISCIRSRFPKLAKLDGDILPASIGFDVQETTNLPQTLPGHLPADIQSFIYGFLEAYYKIYDSEDRQPLIQAYHDQSLFSFSISRHNDHGSHKFAERLITESRNLRFVKDYNQRNKLIKNGKIQVVSAISEMPMTRHEPDSFKIDVPFYNNQFVLIVINGVFRELFKKQEPLRAFCRTFYIVPQGQGFVIVNDLLLITSATVKQIQTFGKSKAMAQQSAADKAMADFERPSSSGIKSRLGPAMSGPPMEAMPTQQTMRDRVLAQFMSATQMNRSFAMQCLEENGFDLNASMDVFLKLKEQNAIPSEAFVH